MTYPKYINELCQVTYDMWNKGWDEYNGGNISFALRHNISSGGTDIVSLTIIFATSFENGLFHSLTRR